jgi:hypothetical protein
LARRGCRITARRRRSVSRARSFRPRWCRAIARKARSSRFEPPFVVVS